MFLFGENFMFLTLKWDDYQFYISVMKIYNLSCWKMFNLLVDQANSLSVEDNDCFD